MAGRDNYVMDEEFKPRHSGQLLVINLEASKIFALTLRSWRSPVLGEAIPQFQAPGFSR